MNYKIHPAIGVARVGNSAEYYIAPEEAGALPITTEDRPFGAQDFRDSHKKLKRQGARFEVYAYDENNPDDPGKPVRPGENDVARIEWTAHIANKKAVWYEFFVGSGEHGYPPEHPLRNADVTDSSQRIAMMIDPGPRTLTDINQSAEFSRSSETSYPMTWPPQGLKPHNIDTLGELHTDEKGRLIVVGGYGNSGSSEDPVLVWDYANNNRWWDDTSDGPITAQVIMKNGDSIEEPVSSWLIVTPPRYAPQLVNIVTLYDTMFDTFVRKWQLRPDMFANGLWNKDFRPNWKRDILPLLERAHHYQWVSAIPPRPHSFDFQKLGDPNPEYNRFRDYYLQIVRPPSAPDRLNSPTTGYPMMPLLCGDNCIEDAPATSTYLTISYTQYFCLLQWAAGKFSTEEPAAMKPGEALDRAALENCVGGPFSPGIEMTWISRNPSLYSEPFRIHRKKSVQSPLSLGSDFNQGQEPGDVSKYMAVPWQADFNECSQAKVGDRFLFWWPVQRPGTVIVRHHGKLKQVPWLGQVDDQNASDYIQFADDLEMVTAWHKLGFIYNDGLGEEPEFVEVGRLLKRPMAPTFGQEQG